MAGCLLVLPGNAALEVIAVIVVKRSGRICGFWVNDAGECGKIQVGKIR